MARRSSARCSIACNGSGEILKKALITGVTGQDGAYLAEFLLNKGYEVHGIKRRASLFNTDRIDHLYQDPHLDKRRFILHYGDMTDSSSLTHVVQTVQPDEIYNLAAQSHVAVSFEEPEYTANSDALGTLRLLEAIRILGLTKKTRFYQASTSELYGNAQEVPQRKQRRFILAARMERPSCMRIGSRSIIAKLTAFTHATGFSSITNRRSEEKLSSLAKSRARSHAFTLPSRIASISAISTPNAIGATLGTTSR